MKLTKVAHFNMKKLKEGHVRTRVDTCTFPLLKTV